MRSVCTFDRGGAMRSMRTAAVVLLVTNFIGCGILGPTCIARQKRGSVTSLSGTVGAGEVAVHRVAYGVEGSQNDAHVQWPDARSAGGPQLRFYATRVACSAFQLPPEVNTGQCAILSRAGSINGGLVASTLIITHGLGNPEQLGNPPE